MGGLSKAGTMFFYLSKGPQAPPSVTLPSNFGHEAHLPTYVFLVYDKLLGPTGTQSPSVPRPGQGMQPMLQVSSRKCLSSAPTRW